MWPMDRSVLSDSTCIVSKEWTFHIVIDWSDNKLTAAHAPQNRSSPMTLVVLLPRLDI